MTHYSSTVLRSALSFYDALCAEYTAATAFGMTVMYLLRKQPHNLPEHAATILRDALHLRSTTSEDHNV
jgi:hypothetical protein